VKWSCSRLLYPSNSANNPERAWFGSASICKRAALVGLLSLCCWLVSPTTAQAAGDPYQDYWTIETPHFRIHYAKNLEEPAQHVATWCEEINRRLTPILGWRPHEVVHVVLTDNSESANGSATALPYNTVRLFLTAPDDMSPLADYDDWLLTLITHEYTHILHTDNISGLPAVVNAIVGKNLAPNQFQPRWVLEGLAVLEESKNTSGGRNESAIFDMYLRADVLENHLASLDQISHTPRRWPGGNLWYLYGSRFLTWIQDTYGEHVMRAVASDYGKQIIPYGINRSMRRATGRTYEELYRGWTKSIRQHYKEQIELSKRDGRLREGKRLTHHGRIVRRPRWIPPTVWDNKQQPEVLYYRDDAHHRTGYYRLAFPTATNKKAKELGLFVRSNDEGSANFDTEGNLLFSNNEIYKRVYFYSDLLRLPKGKGSPRGDEPERKRISFGLRAKDPDVNRAGTELTYVVNRRGTTYLSTAKILPTGKLGPSKVLVPSRRYEQAQTPRFSPDGKKIAYSLWTDGGYKEIRVVDLKTKAVHRYTHNRAMDVQPSWSADGTMLFFSSDRNASRIHNIYALELATNDIYQVTNVKTGAFMPESSPDGKHLLYIGYTCAGFDLYTLPIDRKNWVKTKPYKDPRRPQLYRRRPGKTWPSHPYRAWSTIWPRTLSFQYGPGTFGQTLTLSVFGGDALGLHSITGTLGIDTVQASPQFSISYTYGRLPMDWTTSFFRVTAPRNDYRINDTVPQYIEENIGWSNTLSYTLASAFEAYRFSIGYTLSHFDGSLPVGRNLDPDSQITIDPRTRGTLGVLRAGFSYSNTERYLYSVSPARGFTAQVTADVANEATASEYNLATVGYSLTRYLQMPWHPDHTLILNSRGAISGGNYPRRGLYFVGGLTQIPLIETFRDNIFQGGFVLRGYPVASYRGSKFQLWNVEYRMPLFHPERGLSTLPGFLRRISAAGFLDYGGAFDEVTSETRMGDLFHTGAGGELLIDTTFGYFLDTTARLGYAKGFSREAIEGGQIYFVFSSAY
jgi:hypothetical protein